MIAPDSIELCMVESPKLSGQMEYYILRKDTGEAWSDEFERFTKNYPTIYSSQDAPNVMQELNEWLNN